MDSLNLVIDVGQTFIKFVVINNRYEILYYKTFKNKLLIKNKILIYNVPKLKNTIILTIKKILKKYEIKKIINIAHGSASFFINENNVCLSGPHFSQKSTKSLDKEFFKIYNKKDFTHSIILKNFHNLGKSLFYLLKNQSKLKIKKILTLPSLINYILSDKLCLDKSYLACHSFAWNFKKKNFISFFNNQKKLFPKICRSGIIIGYLKEKYFRKYKIEILNGFHDTSGSYLAYNQNKIKNKILIINTGTYFVISNKTKFKNSIKKNFYYNYGADNNFYLCKRINIGLVFQKYNPKMLMFENNKFISKANFFFNKNAKRKFFNIKIIKNLSQTNDLLKLNYFIALKLSREINDFKKINVFDKIYIDGVFAKNKIFLFFLKKFVKIKVYIIENAFINSLGASKFFFNKKNINLNFKEIL